MAKDTEQLKVDMLVDGHTFLQGFFRMYISVINHIFVYYYKLYWTAFLFNYSLKDITP